MVTWREALEGGARAAICFSLDTLGGAAAIFSDLLRPFPPAQQFETLSNAFRSVCNDTPPNYPAQGVPFTGGQCPVQYNVTISFRPQGGVWRDGQGAGTADPRVITVPAWGQIGGVRTTIQGGGTGQPTAVYSIDLLSRGVQPINFPNFLPTQQWQVVIGAQGVQPGSASVVAQIVSVSRRDGQPDNCGSLPVTIPPPPAGYNRTNINITYQNNDGIDITVPVAFFVGLAFINASAQVEIPVNFTVNANVSFPITFNLSTGGFTLNWNPTFNNPNGSPVNVPFPGGGTGSNPNDYAFDNPPPTPPGGDEFTDVVPPGDQRTELVIRAVMVTVTNNPPVTRGVIFQTGGNPDIYPPDLGMIQFQIRVGQSVAWTNNIRVLNQRAFIECPWMGGAIDVKGTPRTGVQWELTPIYGRANLLNASTPQ